MSDGKGGGQYLVAMPCNVPLVHGDKPAPVVVKKKGKVEAASWQRMMGVLHFLGTNGARDLLLSLVARCVARRRTFVNSAALSELVQSSALLLVQA